MKTIKYIAFIVPIIAFFIATTSCNEDEFLGVKNLYEQSDETYYLDSGDIAEALTGAYAALPLDAGNNNPILVSELMSDDRFGGGGSGDNGFHATDAFTYPPDPNYYSEIFSFSYAGILRVNMILKRFDQAEFSNEIDRNQALGEAYFLRAYFYYRLATFFGTVPLKTTPEPANLPRATPEELFGQIASDLKRAIELMPSTPYQNIDVSRLGHATKWAAEGLMARVFLFYTGYYSKNSIPLPEGGELTKDQVIAWVDDCVAKSGHDLLPDFRNNWPYAYVNDIPYNATIPDFPGAQYPGHSKWAGDGGPNYETVFAIKYSPYGGWSAPAQQLSYSNQLVLYMGLRQQSYLPWGQGWGGGTVNPQLWESFEEGDIRKQGSILDVTDTTEGAIATNYIWGSDNQMHETGFWQKKYIPIYANGSEGMYFTIYGEPNNMQLWNMQDDVLIRFADILLMGAELGSANAQSYFDRVRTRAGLGTKPVSLENIKIERRHELAFEGLRYFDLLRWHDAEAAFATATNIPVLNVNAEATYTVTFRPETGGFLPLPESEVALSNGVLKQTPGWEQ